MKWFGNPPDQHKRVEGRYRDLITLLVAATVGGCGIGPSSSPVGSTSAVPIHRIGLPDDLLYSDGAWIDATTIIIGASPFDGTVGGGALHRLTLGTEKLEPFDVATVPGCRLPEPGAPFRYSGSHLGYVVGCSDLEGPGKVVVFGRELANPAADILGQLGVYNPSQLTASPDGTRIMFGWSSAICGGVAFAGPRGVEYLDPTTAGVGDHAFRVDQAITSETCDPTGRANDPDWSPDGTQVAMVVSPASVGVVGFARIDAPWDLVVMPAGGGAPVTTLVTGISRPTGLRWSPDGRWIAFSESVEGLAPGTYLLEVATRRVVKITDQMLAGPTWSPDGRSIAGLASKRDSITGGSIFIADVGAVVGTASK